MLKEKQNPFNNYETENFTLWGGILSHIKSNKQPQLIQSHL